MGVCGVCWGVWGEWRCGVCGVSWRVLGVSNVNAGILRSVYRLATVSLNTAVPTPTPIPTSCIHRLLQERYFVLHEGVLAYYKSRQAIHTPPQYTLHT